MLKSLDLSLFDFIYALEKFEVDKKRSFMNIVDDYRLKLNNIDNHNCVAYFMNDVFFIEKIIDNSNRKNLFISNIFLQNYIGNNTISQLTDNLDLFRNKFQPNNTLYVGNFSYEEIVKYFVGDKTSILSVYDKIMVGIESYFFNGYKVDGYHSVFVDIDEIKNRLHLVNVMFESFLSEKENYINFDELYFNLDS